LQTALDISSFLQQGSQYTFSLTPSGLISNFYRPSSDDVLTALQGVPGLDALAVVVQPASFFSLGADQFNVTFVYSGDGSDTVASMAGQLIDALSGLSTSFSFVSAYGGPAGAPADTSGLTQAANSLSNVVPSTGSLWAIALIGLIVIFLLSGGAQIVRRAAA
jgi:hypothetical protein